MRKLRILLPVFLTVILLSGFSANDEPEYLLGKNIKLGSAESASMRIEMLIGEMDIRSQNIFHLIQIECEYEKPEWEPKIIYSVEGKKGELYLSNREMKGRTNYDDDDNSNWDLVVNESVPTELEIFLGAGVCDLNLEGSKLRKFDFEMKAGKADLNLKNTSVPNLKFKALAGEVRIDLSGKWENDLIAYIKGGVGDLTLILPDNYAIGLEISGLIGDIDAKGFRKDGRDYYRNPGESEHTLYLDVNGGIGNVEILLSE